MSDAIRAATREFNAVTGKNLNVHALGDNAHFQAEHVGPPPYSFLGRSDPQPADGAAWGTSGSRRWGW